MQVFRNAPQSGSCPPRKHFCKCSYVCGVFQWPSRVRISKLELRGPGGETTTNMPPHMSKEAVGPEADALLAGE
eukprot:2108308-Alexandrium_andersonii.AAC.1